MAAVAASAVDRGGVLVTPLELGEILVGEEVGTADVLEVEPETPDRALDEEGRHIEPAGGLPQGDNAGLLLVCFRVSC